ncbi:MAG: hypothetical protein WBG90_19020 [Saonia sp.]
MKTYNIWYVLLALLVIGCSESEDGQGTGNDDDVIGVAVDYSLLLTNNGMLSGSLLNANIDVITANPAPSPFGTTVAPSVTYRDGTVLSYFENKSDCSGEVSTYDFDDDAFNKVAVFQDVLDCELSVKAIAHSNNSLFIAYSVPTADPKLTNFFIRVVDIDSADFVDVVLEKEPKQLIFSGDRLFILSIDEDISEKNALVVLNAETNTLVHEVNLDLDVQKIAKNTNGDILVSYPNLHLVINKTTLGIISTVRYADGKEAKFGFSERSYFDSLGNLYFQRPSDTGDFPHIPAVYDFSTNTAILYFYENFLTEQQRFEFDPEDTSMVSYDAKNNLILIGYKKSGDTKGGLIRIKPAPDPKFVDHIDLDGVPYDIFVK